jgi:hypothetical protein
MVAKAEIWESRWGFSGNAFGKTFGRELPSQIPVKESPSDSASENDPTT